MVIPAAAAWLADWKTPAKVPVSKLCAYVSRRSRNVEFRRECHSQPILNPDYYINARYTKKKIFFALKKFEQIFQAERHSSIAGHTSITVTYV